MSIVGKKKKCLDFWVFYSEICVCKIDLCLSQRIDDFTRVWNRGYLGKVLVVAGNLLIAW